MDDPAMAHFERRRLVFRAGEQRHEIDAGLVLEVVRIPHITRVPHGPPALVGLANLRGRPIPVLSMDRILNGGGRIRQDGRIIVCDHRGGVGLLVDEVLMPSAETTATPLGGLGERLDAAFKVEQRSPVERPARVVPDGGAQAAVRLTAFLSFRVAGQLYGLPLDHIREVAVFAGEIAVMPDATGAVIGLLPLRGKALPLVSLAFLLGLEDGRSRQSASRIVVVEHDADLVGLVVDEMDVIRRLPPQAIDAVPALLQRGRGDAQIEAIGRIADGGVLMSILSPAKLFGHQAVTQAIAQNPETNPMDQTAGTEETVEQFLVFQLGDEHYGLPITSVDEVIRVPDDITRLPGAPGFVMGVVNLRGRAIPLIDQRARFDTSVAAKTAKARAIVMTLGPLQAGFVVDGVSEVKALSSAVLSAAPEFSSDRTKVFDRVAHLETLNRMILLIDPQELLTRAERDAVAALAIEKTMAAEQ